MIYILKSFRIILKELQSQIDVKKIHIKINPIAEKFCSNFNILVTIDNSFLY